MPPVVWIIDVSNPDIPLQIGYFYSVGQPTGLFAQSGYLYIAEQQDCSRPGCLGGGLRIVDVKSPANPVEVSCFWDARRFLDVLVVDNLAYLVDANQGLWIVDVSDPVDTRRVGSYGFGHFSGDLAVNGSYAYLVDTDTGLWVMDIHDPADPIKVGILPPDFTSKIGWYLDVIGDFVYVGGGFLPVLEIVEVSVPAQPAVVSRFGGPGNVVNMDVSGDKLYIPEWGIGLWALDISNPRAIKTSSIFGTWYPNAEVEVNGNYAYLHDEGRLHILDLSDLTDVQEVGVCETSISVWDMVADDQNVYMVSEPFSQGLFIADVSDPGNPDLVGSYLITSTNAVTINGDYVFVTGGLGLHILDASEPANILQVGYYPQGGNDLEVVGNTIYQATLFCDEIDCYSGLQVLDISDPTEPTLVLQRKVALTAEKH